MDARALAPAGPISPFLRKSFSNSLQLTCVQYLGYIAKTTPGRQNMPLQLEVLCTDRPTRPSLSEEKRMQVIGEILPFVLAKYGARAFERRQLEREPKRASQRFQRF